MQGPCRGAGARSAGIWASLIPAPRAARKEADEEQQRALRVAGAVAALAAVGAVAASRYRRDRRGRQGAGRPVDRDQGQPKPRFDAPESVDLRRRSPDRQQDEPEQDRPAHVLARREGASSPRARTSSSGACKLKDVCKDVAIAHERRFPRATEIDEPDVENGSDGLGRPLRRGRRGRLLVHGDQGRDHEPPGDGGALGTSGSCASSTRRCRARSRSCPRGSPTARLACTSTREQGPARLGAGPFSLRRRSAPARWRCRSALELPGFGPSPTLASPPQPFRAALPVPEVLTSAQIELDMVEAEVDILPGRPTEMWTYGGHLPRPDDPPTGGRAD